jgi:hypothetical protein
MENTRLQSIAMSILAAGLFVAIQGCGSSSSNNTAQCEQACVKVAMCLADASASSAMTTCSMSCSTGAGGASGKTTCSNQAAIDSATQKCLAMSDCTAFIACGQTVPTCQTATGTGGTSGTGTGGTNGGAGHGGGTGGTGGAGGAGSTATCSICDKANSCCMAIATSLGQPTTSCTLSTATCNSSGANSAAYASSCQTALTDGAALGLSACQ